ncbi:hypothetical protein K458DRAFT_390535 [Lentithecium fluviatile CBS 122367]|uniref:Uncharacterized protein n=1 Tax=Lentithecium fluviatile CBS 122367 TaxID=1168545 RepID=A0A6G1IXA5_9PLEO|nr:hypothetical protein K458DRAFT_390535 [Lentithecium fluviatile CBS 122367]
MQRAFEVGCASPFDLDPGGWPLLCIAIFYQAYGLCRLLISQGADVYQEDCKGFSAYHYAWDRILCYRRELRLSKLKQALLELFPKDEGCLDDRQFSRVHKCVVGIIGANLEDELKISTFSH